MTGDAILPLASVGKMFTASAAMILVDRGVLGLDDSVSKYIPEFADVRLANHAGAPPSPITVRHLLTHTSGLTVEGNGFWSAWDEHVGRTTTTDFAKALAELPLVSQPGERFDYGQTGAAYEVLGAVIEIASGQTLEAFMEENIFEPLGLHDTFFYVPEEKAHRLPAIYRKTDDGLLLDREAGKDFSRSDFFHSGGGVRSSAADILTFARLFLEGGTVNGVRILQVETVAMMMDDHIGDKAPERWRDRGLSWGFGAAVERDPGAAGSIVKYGWVGGGFAKLWIDRREGLIAFLGVPLTPPGDNALLARFEAMVYAALDKPEATPADRNSNSQD